MKETDKQFDEVERQLQKARPAEPTDELKTRILGAARQTWKNEPAEVPWRIPLRHLGLSAVAALLIVSCANYFSEQAVAPWQAGRPAPTRMVAAAGEDEAEGLSSPFVRHVLATCGTSARSTSALLDYLQSVPETMHGAEPDEAAEGSGPGEPESREGKTGMMEHWNGRIVAGLGHRGPHHPTTPTFRPSIPAEGVVPCIDDPRES